MRSARPAPYSDGNRPRDLTVYLIEIAALVISACARCLVLWKFDRRRLLSFTRSSTVNREGWHGVTGSFLSVSATRHVSCAYVALLVREGSVIFYALRNQAPAILSLYRSQAWLIFLSRLVDAPLMLCPEDDPHSCALYYYTRNPAITSAFITIPPTIKGSGTRC